MNLEEKLEIIIEQIDVGISEKKTKEEKDLFNKAKELSKEERYKESIYIYDQLIRLNSKKSNYWNNKGVALGNTGKKKESIEYYDKAIEINPKEIIYLRNKAFSLMTLKRLEEAIEYYDKAIEIDPNNADNWFSKGRCYSDLDDQDNELLCYGNVIELDPQHDIAWNNGGTIFSTKGDKKFALDCYKKALNINPKNKTYQKNIEIVKEEIKSESKLRKAKNKLADIVSKAYKPILKTTFGVTVAGGLAYGAYKAHNLFLNLANYFYVGSMDELKQESIINGSSEIAASFVASTKYVIMNGSGGALTGAVIGLSMGLMFGGLIGVAGAYDGAKDAIKTTAMMGVGIGFIAGAGGFLGAEIAGPMGTLIGAYCSPLVAYGIGRAMEAWGE